MYVAIVLNVGYVLTCHKTVFTGGSGDQNRTRARASARADYQIIRMYSWLVN